MRLSVNFICQASPIRIYPFMQNDRIPFPKTWLRIMQWNSVCSYSIRCFIKLCQRAMFHMIDGLCTINFVWIICECKLFFFFRWSAVKEPMKLYLRLFIFQISWCLSDYCTGSCKPKMLPKRSITTTRLLLCPCLLYQFIYLELISRHMNMLHITNYGKNQDLTIIWILNVWDFLW